MAEVAAFEPPIASFSPPQSRKRSASPSPARTTATELSSTTLATTNNGNNDDTAVSEPPNKKTKLIRRKRRPARPQIDPALLKTADTPPQTGTVFNIWYNKWAGGDREDAALSQRAALNRCNIKTDAGWTSADKTPGSFFCLFFARGICPKGHECQYLHRLPTLFDQFNPNVDCFGRDKHSDYRDDMGGVGSFLRQNRTLYVGRIHVTDDIEEVVARHFQEWGEIDRIRVLTGRGVAFVTYVNEANGQFAKEAMAHQALDHEEVLNVRWATVDPNPLSQKREAARIEEQAAEAVRRALPAAFVAELEGRETQEMREERLRESRFGLEGYEAPDEIWHARAREIETQSRQRQQIGGSDEARKLLHASAATDAELGQTHTQGDANGLGTTDDTTTAQHPPSNVNSIGDSGCSGIISASTLTALKGYSGRSKGPVMASKPPVNGAAAGAGSVSLVAYGSDDDDED